MEDAESADGAAPPGEPKVLLHFAGLILDLDACTLARESGEAIALTRGEFALLRFFVSRPRRVLSRDTLLDVTAGRRFDPFDRSVDVMVGRLRRKVEPDPKAPRLIVTVPGIGYQFAAAVRKARPTAAPEPKEVAVDAPKFGTLAPPSVPIVTHAQAPGPAAAPSTSAERRPIVLMICDLVGSIGLTTKLDPEDWRNLVKAYLDEASKVVTELGGHVLTKLGDRVTALFGYPEAQENDAERAVRAALAIQRAVGELNDRNISGRAAQLATCVGLASGSVVVEATGELFGEVPNIAARVQALAEPGAIVVTANVHRQVAGLFVAEDKGAHELKGVAQPVTLYRIVRASGGRRGFARPLTPLVGRADELNLLSQRWERAIRGEGQLTLVVGEPGIGKTRLVEELRARLGETPYTFVEWSSSQLLQNTPLHPIAEWGRLRFGGADVPAEKRLADLENTLEVIGLDPADNVPLLAPIVDIPVPEGRALNLPPEELRERQMTALAAWTLAGARSQPIMIVFEDLQWADPTSLDFMRALAERGAQAPLCIVATARPEFRPPWAMRPHHSMIALGPLSPPEVASLVGALAPSHAFAKDMVEEVSKRTGGVPLFIEEVTRLLLERGVEDSAQAIPPTLQQSLVARLDRLGPAREIAQICAVLGRDFSSALLSAVAGVGDRGYSTHPTLQTSIDRLTEADVLTAETVGRQPTYRFKHSLIKEAAYETLLKSRRQALHCRAAEALRDAQAEPEEIAHHFTEAGLDDPAIEWWGKAGDMALRRSALQEAIAHLGKAIAMADKQAGAESERPVGDTEAAGRRLKLQSDYAMAVAWSRGWADQETAPAFARARSFSQPDVHSRPDFVAQHGHCIASLMRGDVRTAREAAEAFLRQAERERRPTETGVALRALGLTCWGMGEFKMASVSCERAIAEYDSERDRDARFPFGQDTKAAAAAFLSCSYWVIGRLEEARALSDSANAWAGELAHDPSLANAWILTAILEILRSDAGAALQAADRLIEVSRRRDLPFYLLWGQILACYARGRLFDPEAGAKELREALAAYLERGNKYFAPWIYGMMADLEAMTGRVDNALASTEAGLALAEETGDRWTDALLHRFRGDILLKRDHTKPALAEEAFKTAIVIAKQQGARSHELLAALALAKLYQAIGRPSEARAVVVPALEGFTPTPEMPEIAEALALVERLA